MPEHAEAVRSGCHRTCHSPPHPRAPSCDTAHPGGCHRRGPIEGHEVALVAPEDLIISKLDWMRETRSEVQLADVRNLLRSVPDLDKHYLERWSRRLGLDALYREALGD